MGVCAFRRGSTATLYVNFTDINGAPQDSTTTPVVEIILNDSVFVPAFDMTKIKTGLYYADWEVPSSALVSEYSARFSGVLDTKTVVTSQDFRVVGAFV
jgi:hypothetical protein